jgi:DAK2 domain fusion protein YloV
MHMTTAQYLLHIEAAVATLSEHVDEINKLNVFPVPDGDTGTNMSLTLETVVKELREMPADASLDDVRKTITHGSLMGARGNSGVITSQILRGLCEGLEGATKFDAPTIAVAINRAVEVAFNAVRKPVEGTILTVIRDCATAAATAAESGKNASETLHAISEEALASVRRTPDLLPVLKENGVVDAGGYGLAILIEGFSAAVSGQSTYVPSAASISAPQPTVAIEQINDWEGSEFLYCTEFLLNSDSINESETLDFLETMGDCELLVGTHPDFKVHVHTNEPGTVLTYMTQRGQVSEVHIHNMQLQSASRASDLAAAADATQAAAPPKPLGYIAVCAGAGTAKILTSQGVDHIIRGGQTMNPSTKDFVDAIAAVNAEKVIVFPNNKNVILAANAAVEIAEKPAAVVPTTSVPQSFSAMFASDPEASLDENVDAMIEAIAEVRSAEITTAIKKAKAADGRAIAAGDVIGIADGSIEVVGRDVSAVALELIALIAADADVLTLLAGQDFKQDALDALVEQAQAAYPDLEVDAHRGEQPLYPLVMSAE